jgi:hypothetical protein
VWFGICRDGKFDGWLGAAIAAITDSIIGCQVLTPGYFELLEAET